MVFQKMCDSASSYVTQTTRGVFSGKVDVLTLHFENGVEKEEQLMKNIISYLISQQYRRSEEAQTVNFFFCCFYVPSPMFRYLSMFAKKQKKNHCFSS